MWVSGSSSVGVRVGACVVCRGGGCGTTSQANRSVFGGRGRGTGCLGVGLGGPWVGAGAGLGVGLGVGAVAGGARCAF